MQHSHSPVGPTVDTLNESLPVVRDVAWNVLSLAAPRDAGRFPEGRQLIHLGLSEFDR